MRGLLAVAVALLACAIAVESAGSAPRTLVTTWNPFDATGAIKSSLRIERLGSGSCGDGAGSETIGDYGYRCFARGVADPCWRDGPASTEYVVCPAAPWDRRAATIRVPRLMLESGVTFAAPVDVARDLPWALELADGNRCLLAQGAHGYVVIRGRRVVIDYYCARDHVSLLRNLRRGSVWRIGAVRDGSPYAVLGDVTVSRAIFPSLPPPMRRQNDLARHAALASGLPIGQVLRVRISFPALDWAEISALPPETSNAIDISAVVHIEGSAWRVVQVRKPVCKSPQLSLSVRRQLFGCRA